MNEPTPPPPPERYAAYFGEADARKCAARFARFDAGGSPLSWNWGAFAFTFGWLIDRRMGRLALLYFPLSVPAALFVAGAQKSDPCGAALRGGGHPEVLAALYLATVFLALPAFADYVHYRIVRRRVSQEGAVPAPGSPRVRRAVALVAVLLSAAFALLPAGYDDAATRARISNAYGALRTGQLVLTEAWQDQGRFPDKADVILPPADAKAGTVAADASGTLTLTLAFPPVAGRRLVVTPQVGDGQLRWSCASPDLPDACVPLECRHSR